MLLSGPMVRAFLAVRKTQTRRLSNRNNAQPSDRIWFREAYFSNLKEGGSIVKYRADNAERVPIKWTPSIFMPKSICRCWADIIAVREEELRDITYEEALAEGMTGPDALFDYSELWDSLHNKPGTRWADNPSVFVFTFKKIDL